MTQHSRLRILFVGPLWEATSLGTSTCLSRLRAMRSLGLNVVSLDTADYLPSRPRLLRSVVRRTYMHPSVYRMNMRLRTLFQEAQYDIVWIEKGDWVYPWTLAWARRQRCAMVHYNTDDILGRHEHLWLHRLGIKYYDLYLTTNRHNVTEIRRSYSVNTVRVGMGYDAAVHRPLQAPKRDERDVVFIGTWRPSTEHYIMALRNAGIDVQVWGHNWRKARNGALRTVKPLPHSEYVSTIAQAKIALCTLSRWNRNESTGRSFEIPAIGTFMLAERTAEHEFIYGDGIGAALFSTPEELVEKARYYLTNPAEREAIAAGGHVRSQNPGYSWTDHIRREWPIVERMLAQPGSMPVGDEDAPFWQGFRNGAMPPQARKGIKREDE